MNFAQRFGPLVPTSATAVSTQTIVFATTLNFLTLNHFTVVIHLVHIPHVSLISVAITSRWTHRILRNAPMVPHGTIRTLPTTPTSRPLGVSSVMDRSGSSQTSGIRPFTSRRPRLRTLLCCHRRVSKGAAPHPTSPRPNPPHPTPNHTTSPRPAPPLLT